jgi:hypothetical protein
MNYRMKKPIQSITKTKCWCFEKIKINKPLEKLTKRRKKTKLIKSEVKGGHITRDTN